MLLHPQPHGSMCPHSNLGQAGGPFCPRVITAVIVTTMVLAAANDRHLLCALPCAGTLLSSLSGDPRRDVCAVSGVEGGLGPCPGSHTHQAVAETCSKAWGS